MTSLNTELAITINAFQAQDALEIIALLKENEQYSSEKVEGIDAMQASSNYKSHLFFVAKYKTEIVGVIRGTHEGYRTMIHLLSVKPAYQSAGIGKQLVDHFRTEVQARGGSSICVTAAPEAQGYWCKMGFNLTNVTLMLRE